MTAPDAPQPLPLLRLADLPRDVPLYHESAEQAAARVAAAWGCPVTVYVVGVKCPMIFIAKKEGE